MVKVIMHGCNGHMGQVITQLVEKDPEIEIVAGIYRYLDLRCGGRCRDRLLYGKSDRHTVRVL